MWAAWELLRSPPPESMDLDVTVWSGVQAELQWGGQHAQRPAGDRDPGPQLPLPRHFPGFCMEGGQRCVRPGAVLKTWPRGWKAWVEHMARGGRRRRTQKPGQKPGILTASA